MLFIPINLLIVPPGEWKPQTPSLPRNVIASISATVLQLLGSEATPILAMIRDRKTDDIAVIEQAGALLWPRAASLLASHSPPVGWEATGLRSSLYPPLASAIAAILRIAIDLRALANGGQSVSPALIEQRMAALVAHLVTEGGEIQSMALRLLLSQIPSAVPLLRRLISSGTRASEKLALRAAMDLGVDAILLDLEGEQGLTSELRHSALCTSAAKASRLAGFLLDVEADPDALRFRPRLKPIRTTLDEVCQARLKEGMREHIVRPLETAGFVADSGTQKILESCARDSKALELSGRRFGNPAAYDAALAETAAALRQLCVAGGLTKMRKLRLLEILLGPDAAEAEYRLEQSESRAER